ncbi:MAG TPA: MerR family transcriptional regulator [Jatrophihabitans sp.]|jgi:DNA-binding transcriptional MerR regulator|uniref:MerR family transcriptional regulator n=1 Tax=Jatrophihabitans sp. TaxID=1932789 RepID=UPI002F23E2F2
MEGGSTGDGAGVYSIGAVANMLGIQAQTLRAWEERYTQIVPSRSPGGQRLYSRDQVAQLRFVREQIESGLQPADAHRLLAERRDFERPLAPQAGEPGYSILLAERDPYAADFVEYFLRTEGYTSLVVLDASQAEEILDNDQPHLLVVDLMISGGAGLALVNTARKRTAIPILAVSALDSRDDAFEAGADAFLKKPLEPLQFLSTVRDLLGTSAYLGRRAQGR